MTKRIRKRDGTVITAPDNYTVQDGEAIITSMQFMDHATDDTTKHARIDDASLVAGLRDGSVKLHDGRGGPVGHRPGFALATPIEDAADTKQLKDAAVSEYERKRGRLAAAWATRRT